MPMQDTPHAPATRLALAGELTIYAAAEWRDTLARALAEARVLELDLAEVGEIDTAGMQLLMAAMKQAREAGTALRLVNHSACVLRLIELYDLAGWFDEPLRLPAAAAA